MVPGSVLPGATGSHSCVHRRSFLDGPARTTYPAGIRILRTKLLMLLLCSDDSAVLQRWQEAVAIVSGLSGNPSGFAELERYLFQNPEALVLLDLRLRGLHDGDGVEALVAVHPSVKLLTFSPACDDREGVGLIRLGVAAYLPLESVTETVARAIGTVASGEFWMSRRLLRLTLESWRADHLRDEHAPPAERLVVLTHRQQEVALMVCKGLTNKQIAQRLGITEGTVKAHLTAIFERTKTRSRTELVLHMRADVQPASRC